MNEIKEYKNRIKKAIETCEHLIVLWDRNCEIDDIDICHIIEILKGRE